MLCSSEGDDGNFPLLTSWPLGKETMMNMTLTNMRVLQPSRKRRLPGDVFAYQMPDGMFRFGRLIAMDVPLFGANIGTNMVYFFRGASLDKVAPQELQPTDLLLPPLLVNQKPWTLGFFEVIDRRPLKAGETLAVHCFRSPLLRYGRVQYFNEAGIEIEQSVEPCGFWALHSYRTVDDALSDVLGFEKVPDS